MKMVRRFWEEYLLIPLAPNFIKLRIRELGLCNNFREKFFRKPDSYREEPLCFKASRYKFSEKAVRIF
jgi:hypothetical protein